MKTTDIIRVLLGTEPTGSNNQQDKVLERVNRQMDREQKFRKAVGFLSFIPAEDITIGPADN